MTGRRGQARARLLAAADELFTEHGYDATTTRDVADRSGLDAALIARHFGGKLGLYLATLTPLSAEEPLADLLDPGRMTEMLGRASASGPGPVFRAAVTPHPDAAVQAAARAALHDRVVGPLTARYTAAGIDRPQLHAEIAVAAFVGISLGRASAAFDELAAVDVQDLVVAVSLLLAPPGETPPQPRRDLL